MLRGHNNFSGGFAVAQQVQRLLGAVEREDMADMWVQSAARVPVKQNCHAAGQGFRRKLQIAALIQPDHAQILYQQVIGRNLRHIPAGKTDRDKSALGVGGAHRLKKRRATDGVIDHINTAQ